MNVPEILVSDFKMLFPGIFNFTVGILVELGVGQDGPPGNEPKVKSAFTAFMTSGFD